MILDSVEIQKLLPHRYPFLMVDAILEIERLKRIVGIKNVTMNEYYFQGHFPGQAGHAGRDDYRGHGADRRPFAAAGYSGPREQAALFCGRGWRAIPAAGSARRSTAHRVNVLNWRGDFVKLQGRATVNGELAAEGTVMCKMIDREPPAKAEEPAK